MTGQRARLSRLQAAQRRLGPRAGPRAKTAGPGPGWRAIHARTVLASPSQIVVETRECRSGQKVVARPAFNPTSAF